MLNILIWFLFCHFISYLSFITFYTRYETLKPAYGTRSNYDIPSLALEIRMYL